MFFYAKNRNHLWLAIATVLSVMSCSESKVNNRSASQVGSLNQNEGFKVVGNIGLGKSGSSLALDKFESSYGNIAVVGAKGKIESSVPGCAVDGETDFQRDEAASTDGNASFVAFVSTKACADASTLTFTGVSVSFAGRTPIRLQNDIAVDLGNDRGVWVFKKENGVFVLRKTEVKEQQNVTVTRKSRNINSSVTIDQGHDLCTSAGVSQAKLANGDLDEDNLVVIVSGGFGPDEVNYEQPLAAGVSFLNKPAGQIRFNIALANQSEGAHQYKIGVIPTAGKRCELTVNVNIQVESPAAAANNALQSVLTPLCSDVTGSGTPSQVDLNDEAKIRASYDAAFSYKLENLSFPVDAPMDDASSKWCMFVIHQDMEITNDNGTKETVKVAVFAENYNYKKCYFEKQPNVLETAPAGTSPSVLSPADINKGKDLCPELKAYLDSLNTTNNTSGNSQPPAPAPADPNNGANNAAPIAVP